MWYGCRGYTGDVRELAGLGDDDSFPGDVEPCRGNSERWLPRGENPRVRAAGGREGRACMLEGTASELEEARDIEGDTGR